MPIDVRVCIIHVVSPHIGWVPNSPQRILLHSFAHLFVELSAPKVAREALNETQRLLEADGYEVSQSAFGWFNRLEMRAKGHPLSRVARQV